MTTAATKKTKMPYHPNLAIDTLALAESLQEVGVPAKQAKRHVQMVADVFEHNMSTKADVEGLRKEIIMISKDMAEMKSQILMWVAGMLLAQAGFIAALQKLLT